MSTRTERSRRAFLRMAGAVMASVNLPAIEPRAEEPVPENDRITAVTLIHGIPGQGEDLKRHLLSLADPTRAEPGCITYDLYQSPDVKHEFMRFEVWAGQDALEAHKRTPHLRASFERRQREGWNTQILTWIRVPG